MSVSESASCSAFDPGTLVMKSKFGADMTASRNGTMAPGIPATLVALRGGGGWGCSTACGRRPATPAADASASAVKRKYQAVLQLIEGEHVRVLNLHVEGGRLYLKGAAPTEEARGRILAAIRSITPEDDADIVADITVG